MDTVVFGTGRLGNTSALQVMGTPDMGTYSRQFGEVARSLMTRT